MYSTYHEYVYIFIYIVDCAVHANVEYTLVIYDLSTHEFTDTIAKARACNFPLAATFTTYTETEREITIKKKKHIRGIYGF